jgi:hypothetical protein
VKVIRGLSVVVRVFCTVAPALSLSPLPPRTSPRQSPPPPLASGPQALRPRSILRPRGIEATASGRQNVCCAGHCSSDASMSLCNVSHGFIYSFQCDLVSTLTVDIHLYFQLLSAPNHGGSCLLEQTFHRVLLFSTVASYSLFCDTQSYIQYSVSK